MRAHPMVTPFVCSLWLALTSRQSAMAFNYPEHAYITEQGLAILLEAHPEAADVLAAIRRVVNSDRMCPAGELFTIREGCFGLPDLPALAADHSSSPPALLARWFAMEPGGQLASMMAGLERVNNALLVNVGAAIAHADPGNDQPPECGEPTAPSSVRGFIRATRKYRVKPGLAVPTADLDTDLAAIDADYLCLALNGSHHFRVPNMSLEDAAYAEIPNALGAYTNYHLAALAFARLSAEGGPDRDRWRGLAILSEMFALHFIEDSVAAGHQVVDYGTLNPASIRATHDHYNHEGLMVRIPERACQAVLGREARFPRLTSVCWPDDGADHDLVWRTGRVRGDGAISRAETIEDPFDVTLELSALLVAESLAEVVDATRPALVGPVREACIEEVRGCIDPAPGRSLELSCTLRWFETEACAPRANAVQALRQSRLAALAMLPTSAERVAPTYIFSGHALVLSSSYRISGVDDLGGESLNMLGVGWSYTTPPTATGAFTLGVAAWLPALRTASVLTGGLGVGMRLDWLPMEQFFMVGGGATIEVTGIGTEYEHWSSFFFGSIGTEIVNTDTVSFRMTGDVGCHVPWSPTHEGSAVTQSACNFAAGITLSLAFKVDFTPRD
ncbi:MAG: hypothetical protein IT385_18490 [Deltaproteobacteria bacterium]|nr:hypothetical protein [Deltaproteobacteria bacterium]